MALLGNKTSSMGIDSTYHIIRSLNWDKFYGVSIVVESYVDQASRNLNTQPLDTATFTMPKAPVEYDLSVTTLYDHLKTIADFSEMTSDNV